MKIIKSEPDQLHQSTSAPWTNCEQETSNVATFFDAYPVTPGHRLFVPKHNLVDCLMQAMADAVARGMQGIDNQEWQAFNVGINIGAAAGQTCDWPHVHLIPRRTGDMQDPTGGVRHVVPEKGNYRRSGYIVGDLHPTHDAQT